MSKEDLDGLPESWFKGKKKIKGKFKVTLKYPDYYPIMKYVNNEKTRKKMYIAFNSRCKEKNLPLFEKAIELRSKLSKELGYKSHADFKTEVKIVKNAETA